MPDGDDFVSWEAVNLENEINILNLNINWTGDGVEPRACTDIGFEFPVLAAND